MCSDFAFYFALHFCAFFSVPFSFPLFSVPFLRSFFFAFPFFFHVFIPFCTQLSYYLLRHVLALPQEFPLRSHSLPRIRFACAFPFAFPFAFNVCVSFYVPFHASHNFPLLRALCVFFCFSSLRSLLCCVSAFILHFPFLSKLAVPFAFKFSSFLPFPRVFRSLLPSHVVFFLHYLLLSVSPVPFCVPFFVLFCAWRSGHIL